MKLEFTEGYLSKKEESVNLNELGLQSAQSLIDAPDKFGVELHSIAGCRVIDCGINARGGLAAGIMLAKVCLADLANVELCESDPSTWQGPAVRVTSDHPVAACMGSQYAGWPISSEGFFGMGSGPMRAARGRESLLDDIGINERPESAVGIIETNAIPSTDVCQQIAEECRVEAQQLTLLVARTASLAGTIQIVSRSIETALHKMHELKFDIDRVKSGFGIAPLPPVAANDIAAVGRTNDAVLYGGEVTLWLTGNDESLETIGPKIPSSSSPDYGQPFSSVFENYDRDFYKIDRLLFSPAVVTLVNLDTGSSHRYGETHPDVLLKSFT